MRRLWVSVGLLAAAWALVSCGGAARKASPTAVPISRSVCSPLTYGGEGRPRFLIPLVDPFQGPIGAHGVQNAQATKLVLQQRGWRAGHYTVGTQLCEEASAAEPVDVAKCQRNARAFASNPNVVAVIGPAFSSCAAAMIPILNRAPGGPVVLISQQNTYLGLTRAGPGVADGHPASLYPTGKRNYVRLAPADDAQAAALVLAARDAGVRRPFLLDDGEDYGRGLVGSFAEVAARLQLRVAGRAAWDGKAPSFAGLARRIHASGADGVLIAGYITSNGPRLVRDLRDGLGRAVPLLASDGFNLPETIVEGAGDRAEGLTLSIASGPIRTLGPDGRRWAAQFERRTGTRPCCFATHTAQAVALALDALADSDGSRAQVLANVLRAHVHDGILGDFHFDSFGDTSQTRIALYRIVGGGVRYIRSVDVPSELLTRR